MLEDGGAGFGDVVVDRVCIALAREGFAVARTTRARKGHWELKHAL